IMLRSRSLLGLGVVGAFTVVASAQTPPAEAPPAEASPAEAPPASAPPPASDATVTAKVQAPATAKIRGRVLAKNGEPIAGAVITLDNGSAISDGDGNYELLDIP